MSVEKYATVGKGLLIPFILLTIPFALWGAANNMTDFMVPVFKDVKNMTAFQSSIIQSAFYGAYFLMALPAAFLIQKTSYKTAVVTGLFIYAAGAFLTLPASQADSFDFFLIAFFVYAAGCAFLETSVAPYVLTMGPEETATQRINLAQAFNPIGSIGGMFLGKMLILKNLTAPSMKDAPAPEMTTEGFRNVVNAVDFDLSATKAPIKALTDAGVFNADTPESEVLATINEKCATWSETLNSVELSQRTDKFKELITEWDLVAKLDSEKQTAVVDAFQNAKLDQFKSQIFDIASGLSDMSITEKIAEAQNQLATTEVFQGLPEASLTALQTLTNDLLQTQAQDLSFVVKAYMAVGIVGLIVGLVILIKKFPVHKDSEDFGGLGASFGRLMKNNNFKFSVLAQFFYVGTQIGVFTYITPYFVEYHTGVSTKDDAASYAIAGMILFILGRFIGTALMKKFDPARILTFMATSAALTMLVAILVKGNVGAMAVVLSFIFMSICFPTIYGLGLTGVGDDRKLGGSFIIMAIVGGAVIVPMQAILVDTFNVAVSFAMPLVGFILVAIYGIVAHKKEADLGILHEGE